MIVFLLARLYRLPVASWTFHQRPPAAGFPRRRL